MTRAGGLGACLNEYHADFLVHERLETDRRAAAHRHLVAAIRRSRRRRRRSFAAMMASLHERLRSILGARPREILAQRATSPPAGGPP